MTALAHQAPRTAATWSALARHPLFKAAAPLLALLLADAILLPGFFHLELKDGHLYGALVDIANRAAPLILAAIGMTLVVATRGVDISVGAVVALAGSVAAVLVGGD
ncbi:MAG TPA: ABC transporter permease, partial [Telluria sp.]|nr:ABC transporter permease [Telluria sp.]